MKSFVKSAAFVAILVLTLPALCFAEVTITGSGASFPAPLYTTWFKDFSKANDGVRVNYQSKGSGAGIRDF